MGSDYSKKTESSNQENTLDNIPDAVIERITEIQEQAYWKLIDLLKVKMTPLEFHKKLVEEVMINFIASDFEVLNRQKLNTQFEIPWSSRMMSIQARILYRHLEAKGLCSGRKPLLATLPSGDVNAMISFNVENGYPVIFFDQSIFPFIYNFAHIVCWTVPPLNQDVTSDSSLLAQLRLNHYVPAEAHDHFEKTLFQYAIEGVPVFAFKKVPAPSFNKELAILLVNLMELFILAHEHWHVFLGHGEKEPGKDLEYEADLNAMLTLCVVAEKECGFKVLGFWACDLVFSAFALLYSTLGIMTFGDVKLDWISRIYPHPTDRALKLYDAFKNMPDVTLAEIEIADGLSELWHKSSAEIWEITERILVKINKEGIRPSPKWKQTVQAVMRGSEISDDK